MSENIQNYIYLLILLDDNISCETIAEAENYLDNSYYTEEELSKSISEGFLIIQEWSSNSGFGRIYIENNQIKLEDTNLDGERPMEANGSTEIINNILLPFRDWQKYGFTPDAEFRDKETGDFVKKTLEDLMIEMNVQN